MPLHLQSITENADKTELFVWILQDGLDRADTIFIAPDNRYIHIQTNMVDTITDSPVGKIVYTLKIDEDQKAMEVKDVDIILNNDRYCEVEFLKLLPGSSDANEYYEIATVGEGQHLEIETVNRHTMLGELEGTKQSLRFSAFPFQLTVYQKIEDFNKCAGFENPINVGNTDMKVFGFSPTFTSTSCTLNNPDEHCSLMLGTVVSYRDVQVEFGSNAIGFVIADVETALGIIPVAMGRDVFDLSELTEGCIIGMYADIKTDISREEDFKSTKKR